MMHHLKVLVTNPLLNVPLGPREVVVSNKHLDNTKHVTTEVDGKICKKY